MRVLRAILVLAGAVMILSSASAWSQDVSKLPDGCKKVIAEARSCIPKTTDEETRTRINHALDMMAENVSKVDPAEQKEACQVTIMTYRQMAGLACTP